MPQTLLAPQRTPTNLDNLPGDIRSLELLSQELQAKIQAIQFKLGDEEKRIDAVRTSTEEEYRRWRNRAKFALNKTLEEYRVVRSKLRDARMVAQSPQIAHIETCDPEDAEDMLFFIYLILSRVVDAGVYVPSDSEWTTMTHAKGWLERNGFFI